ncbi:MAG: DUF971 domain-containing protein [Blastochloris sp.]|nr:DUF971 domain-containing protein [Blastochloris sp.]
MSPQPLNIQVVGSELAVAWNDGREDYFPLEALRRACPCASCAGEPDVTGQLYRPIVSYNDKSFGITKLQIVGGYALQPVWNDGHSSGLYSWQYLGKLASDLPPPS